MEPVVRIMEREEMLVIMKKLKTGVPIEGWRCALTGARHTPPPPVFLLGPVLVPILIFILSYRP
jgi:hypothetical protein